MAVESAGSDDAAQCSRNGAARHSSSTSLIGEISSKEREIVIINTSNKQSLYDNLEEISLTLQHELRHFEVSFFDFNGGNDVWVDIGHIALGIQALKKYVFRFLPKELRGSKEMRNIQGH
ncbi:hypothetical protein PsorP6_013767 [Peronosclerospora sorghi]|uniref:Uncharacterized protein n=1 Tax=Peronosclerospora sorghi TaxID=230839 RepID=A0ACC0VFN3_9STRA|nr:hypothetical protein PsorP6_013767 [Peronosclerospora sorghi]